MFSRNERGERRVSPRSHKFLLTTHIIVSVGWLGIVVAKIALQIAAMTANTPDTANILNAAFPPMAIGTIVTGVLLSLGTKWGLIRYYWVVTKLVLTVAVIMTAIALADRIAQWSVAAPTGQAESGTIVSFISSQATLLLALSVTHLLMLGIATVVSVYKPWGKTWFGRRAGASRATRGGATLTRSQMSG